VSGLRLFLSNNLGRSALSNFFVGNSVLEAAFHVDMFLSLDATTVAISLSFLSPLPDPCMFFPFESFATAAILFLHWPPPLSLCEKIAL